MGIRAAIRILYTSADADDATFAGQILHRVKEFALPQLVDLSTYDAVHELAGSSLVLDDAIVCVLSPALLQDEEVCRLIVRLSQARLLPGYTTFCICRGVDSNVLRATFQDVEQLFQSVDVGDEGQLDDLVRELRDYVAFATARYSPFKAGILYFLVILLYLLRYLLYFPLVHLATVVIPLVAMLASLQDETLLSPAAECGLAMIALFNIGIWLDRVPALDFWPWLGRRRIAPETLMVPSTARRSLANAATWWLQGGCLAPPSSTESWGRCTLTDLECAKAAWLHTALLTLVKRAVLFAALGIPGAFFLIRGGASCAPLCLFAFAAGAALPFLFRWRSRVQRRIDYWKIGLEGSTFERDRRIFGPAGYNVPLPFGNVETPPQDRRFSEEEWMRHWLSEMLICSASAEHPWFPARDYVFISYPWVSESATDTALALHNNLASDLKKKVFLDSREIRPFSAWRLQVVEGLLDCTHVFVVIGSSKQSGETWHREHRLVLNRWHIELLPSAICVADEDVVHNILNGDHTPVELRFLLMWCPVISHAEARDTRLVEQLLRQRRRQGRFRDWLTMLCPPLHIRRLTHDSLGACEKR